MNDLAEFEHLFQNVRRGFAATDVCQRASFRSEIDEKPITVIARFAAINPKIFQVTSPAIFFLRECPFLEIYARRERIFALLVFVLVRVLVEHRHFVAERFL